MELIRQEIEKILLGLALLFLAVTAVALSLRLDRDLPKTTMAIITPITPIPPIKPIICFEPTPISKGRIQWDSGFRLFGSIPRVWKDGKLVATEDIQDGGVEEQLCTWLTKHKLPCTREAAAQDPDEDGWTNREEWKYGAEPFRADSHPTPVQVLHLVRIQRDEFPLRFKGRVLSPDGKQTFQINVRDMDYTYMVKLGEPVANDQRSEDYRVVEFNEATTTTLDPTLGREVARDASRLTLRRISDGKEIVLPFGQIARDSESKAVIRNELDGKESTVGSGEEIEIRGKCYRLEIRDGEIHYSPPDTQTR